MHNEVIAMPKTIKFVYFFGGGKAEGKASMRDLLGGKGAGLHEMTRIGVPVPPGFTITTDVCRYYYARGGYPKNLEIDVNLDADYGILAKVLARAKNADMQKIGFVQPQ